MGKLAGKTRYLAIVAFLCFGGVAFGGPASNVLTLSPFAVIAMPEPSFPLEFGLTAAGFAGLLFLLRKKIATFKNISTNRPAMAIAGSRWLTSTRTIQNRHGLIADAMATESWDAKVEEMSSLIQPLLSALENPPPSAQNHARS